MKFNELSGDTYHALYQVSEPVEVDNYESLELHPACLLLPVMDDDDFQKLKEDISGFGLRHPITLYQDKILDGRHRFRACVELGIEPVFQFWHGGSSVSEFVLAENLYRRQLTAGQKAMVAARSMEYHRQEARKRQHEAHLSRGINDKDTAMVPLKSGKAASFAAKSVGVSTGMVEKAVFINKHGTEADILEVATGAVSLKAKHAEIRARLNSEERESVRFIPASRWSSMSDVERREALSSPTTRKLLQSESDIADFVWEPVVLRDNAIALSPERMLAPTNQHYDSEDNRVLVCPSVDLFADDMPQDWIDQVLSVCADVPSYRFLFTTKNPVRLTTIHFPANCWVGVDVSSQTEMDIAEPIFAAIDGCTKWLYANLNGEPIAPSDPSIFKWYYIGGDAPFTAMARLALIAEAAGASVTVARDLWDASRPTRTPWVFEDFL